MRLEVCWGAFEENVIHRSWSNNKTIGFTTDTYSTYCLLLTISEQGSSANVPARPAGPPGGDIEMGIPQNPPEPADKQMDEFYKEVSLIKVKHFVLCETFF